MKGNIVGEEFEPYVFAEIARRQETQYAGFDGTRESGDIQYLNNKNAWVKLASSVSISDVDQFNNGETVFHGEGTKKLEQIFGSKTLASQFLDTKLAESAILFNGVSSLKKGVMNESYDDTGNPIYSEDTFIPGPGIGYNFRAGVSNSSLPWNLNAAYGLGGSSQGLQPMPGIKDVSIDCLNRGSIRKATLNIVAYNKTQFEIIELLYLRLGYTIMLEWGNDKYYDFERKQYQNVGNTLIEDFFFLENGSSQLEVLTQIEQYRTKYGGNYDGFFGKVVNFDWNFNSDGSYNITLQLITLGDVIESLQANIPVTAITVDQVKSSIKENSKDPTYQNLTDSPIIKSAQNNIIGKWLYDSLAEDYWDNFKRYPDYFSLNSTLIELEYPLDLKTNRKYNYYVSFGEFLRKMQQLIIPLIDNGNGPLPQLEIETNLINNYVSFYPNQTSLDPRVCIFKYELGGAFGEKNKIDINGVQNPIYLDKLKPYIGKEEGIIYGQLMNLYLNFDFIAKCTNQNINKDGKLTIFKFFQSISDGINTALGSINNIEPIIKDDRIITFIDQNPIPGLTEIKAPNDIVDLEFYGYSPETSNSNFVKDISFKTEITPELASMITIGATAGGSSTKNIDATAFSKWNRGLIDRFSKKISDPPEVAVKKEDEEKEIELIKLLKKEWENNSYWVLIGVNDSENSKRRGINYGGISGVMTEEEYIEKRRKIYEDPKILSQEDLTQEKSVNYALYLSEAFGGYSNIKVRQFIRDTAAAGRYETVEIKPVLPKNTQYTNFNDDFISRAKSTFKTYINTIKKLIYDSNEDKNPSNTLGFIPVSFGITLEGISGIKIYNKLNINNKYLPYQYPKAFKFLIQKVNHRITDNTWETILDTISIPNTAPDKTSASEVVEEGRLTEEEKGPIFSTGRFNIIENRNFDPETQRRTELLRNQQPQNFAPKGSIIGITKVLQDIHPDVKPLFEGFLKELDQNYPGYKMILNATGRSFAKSESLREQNNKNALPGFSTHNYYAAIDFNIIDPNGTVYKKKGTKYLWEKSKIPDIAKKHCIEWGGNFSNYEDCVHFYVNFNIETAYNNAVTIARKEGIDITQVDGYTVSLGKIQCKETDLEPTIGPQTEAESTSNNFSSILFTDS